jgi:hypothetical protein
MSDAANREAQAATAKKLVRASTWLAIAGVVSMILGCVGGIAVTRIAESGNAFAFGLVGGIGLGMALLVGAAVLGQIGRAMQGRVI